jgi:hypothetical protein
VKNGENICAKIIEKMDKMGEMKKCRKCKKWR